MSHSHKRRAVLWHCPSFSGGLAQLARASALHAEGQRFESVILHLEEYNDMMEALRPGTGAEERGKENNDVLEARIWKTRRLIGGEACRKYPEREERKQRVEQTSVSVPLWRRNEAHTRHLSQNRQRWLTCRPVGKKLRNRQRAHGGCLGSRRRRRT